MARLTRRELKSDELRSAFEDYEQFVRQNYREILLAAGILIAMVGSVLGLKWYAGRRDAEANAELGAALRTFDANVGTPAPGSLASEEQTFPTAQEKYRKALGQFTEMIQVKGFEKFLPQQKAVRLARYYVGLCQAELGDDVTAVRTLEQASHDADREIAGLGRLALAGELAKTGKLADAVKIYQDLADHPALTVPKATALLALADAYRATQPAQARQLYERVVKEFGSIPFLAGTIKQQVSNLPE